MCLLRFPLFSSCSAAAPDSRLNPEVPKWADEGEGGGARRSPDQPSPGCRVGGPGTERLFLLSVVVPGSPSTSGGEKVDRSGSGLAKTCRSAEAEK